MDHSQARIINTVIGHTDGRPILCDIHFAEQETAPYVIFCHGFKGFKDWGEYPAVANHFAENGLHFLRFNFSHNGGTVKQPIDFPDLQAFGENTYSKEIHDLSLVVGHVKEKLEYRLGRHSIGILAHSRGAASSIIAAAEDDRIKGLCSWAGVSTIGERLGKVPQEQWRESGVHFVPNARTQQDMPMYYSHYEDFLIHKERFDIERQSRVLTCPHLVINAADDLVVPPVEAAHLAEWSTDSEVYTLASGGHTFGAAHPSKGEGIPSPLREACEKSIRFFREKLTSK